MKKYYLIILLSINILVSGQNIRFAVISSPEIGSNESQIKLQTSVNSINLIYDVDFTIFTGNISEHGKNIELEKANDLINKLSSKHFLIPGESDTRFSESGLQKISELFGDDKFIYEIDSSIFIGINSGSDKQIGGHIKPEDIKWITDNLSDKDSTTSVFVFIYHNPKNEIDNWYKIHNLLTGFNKSLIIFGSGNEYNLGKLSEIPLVSIPAAESDKNKMLNFLEVRNDSVFIFNINADKRTLLNKFSLINTKIIKPLPSQSFTNYEAEIQWDYNLNYTLEAELVTANSLIYACDKSGLITCLDTVGNVVWEYDSFGTIINKPVIADGIFAAATLQGDLLTLNAFTGESIQTIGFDDVITTPLISFDYSGQKNLMMPKLTESNAAIILGTSTGKLYCFDLETLQQIWIYENAKGMIASKPVYIENKIIFPAFDGSLYCIDARQGVLNWKWNGIKNKDDFPILCNPVANRNSVFLASNNGNVYAVDILLGRTEWENNKLNAFESIGISDIGHRLFIKSKNDKFHIISSKTSNWVKELNIKFGNDLSNSTPIEYSGQVLFGTNAGEIYLINEKFKSYKLFIMGSSAINSIVNVDGKLLAASNKDGKIIIFKTK